MANQLNEVLAQLQQANAEGLLQKQRIIETKNVFYNTKKDFWQLTPAARNNKKRRVRQLVALLSLRYESESVIVLRLALKTSASLIRETKLLTK